MRAARSRPHPMSRSPQVELDLYVIEPVDNRLAVLHRGPEAHLIGGSNSLFVQAIGQATLNDDQLVNGRIWSPHSEASVFAARVAVSSLSYAETITYTHPAARAGAHP